MPETIKGTDQQGPATYWGQEQKRCPSCQREIKVAALRCRHCGQLFADRNPEGGMARAKQRPPSTRTVVWILALALIPITAPIALVWAVSWWLMRPASVRSLPHAHRVMLMLALIVSTICSAVLTLAAALHSLTT